MNLGDNPELLRLTESGLYCPAGDFYIDPWRAVEKAIVTHAHSDHARWGMKAYLCTEEALHVTRVRLGREAKISTLPYGEVKTIRGVKVSLHPAGHILGSCQVRLELDGEVIVASGDYKTGPDSTTTPFELVKCHTFITESTFGLPIYKWKSDEILKSEINQWWAKNQAQGKASLLMGYALGKAQRALAALDENQGPIVVHGAVNNLNVAYRATGIVLPSTSIVSELPRDFDYSKAVIVAPPSAQGTPWIKRFGDHSAAFLSGWMAIRGTRRRRGVDAGFVMSDHVDWPSMLETVHGTGAQRIWVTHGYSHTVSRYLRDAGLDAGVLSTSYEGEQDQIAVAEGGEEVE